MKWTRMDTCENSRHFATPPLASPRNDVWEASAEIPYWWRVTTQIWVVLLIGRVGNLLQPMRKHYPDLGSDTSSLWDFWTRFSDVISRETSGGVAKCRLFFLFLANRMIWLVFGMNVVLAWLFSASFLKINRFSVQCYFWRHFLLSFCIQQYDWNDAFFFLSLWTTDSPRSIWEYLVSSCFLA